MIPIESYTIIPLAKVFQNINENFQIFFNSKKGLQMKPPRHKPLPYNLKFKKKHGYLQKEFVQNAKV